MSIHRVSLLPVKERPNVHPLHVSMTPIHAENLGISSTDSSFIAALSSSTMKRDIFVFVRIENTQTEFPEIGRECCNGLELACTHKLLRHYDLTPFCDIKDIGIDKDEMKPVLFLRQIHALELSRIVIAVKNQKVYKWARSVNFSTHLLVSMSQGPVLARVDDVLLAPYNTMLFDSDTLDRASYHFDHFDMIALECSPFMQGIITANTEMILTIASDDDIFPKFYLRRLSGDDVLTSSTDECEITEIPAKDTRNESKMLYMSDFTKGFDFMKNTLQNIQSVKFNIVPNKNMWARILTKGETLSQFDDMYIIGLPKSLMMKHLLFDGHLVQVSLKSRMVNISDDHTSVHSPGAPSTNLHTKRANWHIAQVKMLRQEFDNTTESFISPLLHFNLLISIPWNQDVLFFQKYDNNLEGVDKKSKSSSNYGDLPTASEVQVSMVTSTDYKSASSKLLKDYFNKRRVVSVGDVISLNSQDDPDLYQNLSENLKYRHPVIHFRVIHIEPETPGVTAFFVDQTMSSLIQVGCVQGFAPSTMHTYLSHREELSYFEKVNLHGLQRYVSKVKEYVEPYLQLSCNPLRFGGDRLQPSILVVGPQGCGKTSVITFVAKLLHLHVYSVNCQSLCSDTQSASEAKLRNIFTSALEFAPCMLLLENIHMLGKERDGRADDPRVARTFSELLSNLSPMLSKYPIIVMATTSQSDKITHDILDCFLHSVTIENLNEVERSDLIGGLIADLPQTSDVDVGYISNRTAGFVLGDFFALISQVGKQALRRISKLFCELTTQQEKDIQSAGVLLQQNDFVEALDVLQSAHSDSLGVPKIPCVKWQDIGGLASVKADILDTIQLPLRYPKLLAAGLKRSGVLLYGPPGSGKTLLAKAVATECSLNFLSVKGPELINQYVGQSEENVREVFKRAREASPCVIFFDELDSLAPNRGRSGDSGGVMDRVVSQLLAELDGLHRSAEVFVIGATNRPDLLDPAILRPGRFDKLLYLGVCEDRQSQVKVLKALTRKFHLDDDVDLTAISHACPLHITGADLYALCSDAMLNSIRRKIGQLKQSENSALGDSALIVTGEDFKVALRDLTPSVSEAELQRYRELRNSLSPNLS